MNNTNTINAAKTISYLISAYGQKPGISPLIAAGWRELQETYIAAKRQYTTGEGNMRCWPEGFSELLDGRIVYHGVYGNILLAPADFQPSEYLTGEAKRDAYRQAMQ